MNIKSTDESAAVQELGEAAQKKLTSIQRNAQDALDTTTDYIRANPWKAVVGAAFLGGVFAAISHRKIATHCHHEKGETWQKELYSLLPGRKRVQSAAESSEISDFIKQLKAKLHLN